MDPITFVILAALGFEIIRRPENVTRAYAPVKELLEQKFGQNSDIDVAMKDLEAVHESTIDFIKAVERLMITIAGANVNDDPELTQRAQTVLNEINSKLDKEEQDQIVQFIRAVEQRITDKDMYDRVEKEESGLFARRSRLAGDSTTDAPPPPKKEK